MTDDETPTAITPIITSEASARWDSLPADRPLSISLTKGDLDNLFLAIRQSIIAQSFFDATIVAYSNGDVEKAQETINTARNHVQNAMVHIDSLVLHAMTTAEPL